jgi:hypothetical protein
MSDQLHALNPLPRREGHGYLLDTKLGGSQSRSGCCESNPDSSADHPVANRYIH